MVRVISEKLFSPPRSRHSSGETVDKELAARAVEALSSLDSKRFELSDYESSSDSHWDSEVDVDGDSQEPFRFGPADGSAGSEDVLKRRKERRRERNKLSAQAYRLRRREQSVKTQKVLSTLEEENTRLKNQVKDLEQEINDIKQRARLQAPHHPSLVGPSASHSTQPANNNMPLGLAQAPTTQPGNNNDLFSQAPLTQAPKSPFSQLFSNSNRTLVFKSELHDDQHQAVDNDPRRKAPVDNFLFSRGAQPVTMAKPLCFPTGATPLVATPSLTTTPTTLTPPPVIHSHTLHSDHNANASAGMTMGSGVCQNDNMNNNNSNLNNGNVLVAFGQPAAMPAQPLFNLTRAS